MQRVDFIVEKMVRAFNTMQENAKQAHDYGTGQLFYQSELHTLAAICRHDRINASELAQIMGVTKGAITQVINKLTQKGLIEKFNLPGNKKEIHFRVTEAGLYVNESHSQYHQTMHAPVASYLCGLDEEKLEAISRYFDIVAMSIKK